MRSSFFKLPKYKSFNYDPRYFDPEHEELMERVRNAERERERDQEPNQQAEYHKESIRQQFRQARRDSLTMSHGRKMQYRLRVMLIIAVLTMITYIILG